MERTTIIPPPEPAGAVRRLTAFLPSPLICFMFAVVAAGLVLSAPARASLTLSTGAVQDTLVIEGSSESFGGKGAMEIAAPTSSQNRTEEALISWDTSAVKSQFDSYFGVGKWVVTSISVTFSSNYSSAGTQPNNDRFNVISPGLFTLSWLSNDSWDENTVNWFNLSDYLPGSGNSNTMESLGTYYYFADGTTQLIWFLDETPGLLGDILSGSTISIFGTPGDIVAGTVGYLFNTGTKLGNGPPLTITAEAAPVPIPPAFFLLGPGLACLGFLRRRGARTPSKGGRS